MNESGGRSGDPFAIPELTRGLRSFAAPRALGGLHDRFFAPLLDARRASKAGARWSARLAAFDAERLEATVRVTLQTFAAEQQPRSAPERRALAAQLEDACGELFDAMADLGEAEAAVRGAPDDDARTAPWREWVRTLQRTFSAADRGWEHASRMLAAAPPSAPGWWRRVARRSRRR